MVPAIFKQMERAEDSDGFESCEDEKEEAKVSGNPFKDFAGQIKEVANPDEACKLRLRLLI